jgi:hypothetical protein
MWGGREEQQGSAAVGKQLIPAYAAKRHKQKRIAHRERGEEQEGEEIVRQESWCGGRRIHASPWLSGKATQQSVSPEESILSPTHGPTLGQNWTLS